MRFLEEIILENFQSHEYTVLKLTKGLNVLLGNSDSGKTAVIRGVRWVLYNEPRGDYFIQHGKKTASVTLKFDDGSVLKRYRNKGTNGYLLITPKGEEFVFENFGVQVPEEISRFFHIRKTSFTANDEITLNIADQLSGPFLLGERDSVKASAIGKLVGVDLIDEASAAVVSDIRSLRRKGKEISEKIAALDLELEDMAYLDEELLRLERLKEIRNRLRILLERKKYLEVLATKKNEISQEKDIVKRELKNLVFVENLAKIIDRASTSLKDYHLRILFLQRRMRICEEKKRVLEDLERYKEVTKLQEMVNDLDKKVNALVRYQFFYDNISYLREQYHVLEKENSDLKGVGDLRSLVEQLSQMINTHRRLFLLFSKQEELNHRIEKGKEYILTFKDLVAAQNGIYDIENFYKRLSKLNTISFALQNISKEKFLCKNEVEKTKSDVKTFQKSYEEMLLKIGICPTCRQPIDADSLIHIHQYFKEG